MAEMYFWKCAKCGEETNFLVEHPCDICGGKMIWQVVI